MKSIKLGYILCHFPCMDLPLTPVGKNQWQNMALTLKTTNADLGILVLI